MTVTTYNGNGRVLVPFPPNVSFLQVVFQRNWDSSLIWRTYRSLGMSSEVGLTNTAVNVRSDTWPYRVKLSIVKLWPHLTQDTTRSRRHKEKSRIYWGILLSLQSSPDSRSCLKSAGFGKFPKDELSFGAVLAYHTRHLRVESKGFPVELSCTLVKWIGYSKLIKLFALFKEDTSATTFDVDVNTLTCCRRFFVDIDLRNLPAIGTVTAERSTADTSFKKSPGILLECYLS